MQKKQTADSSWETKSLQEEKWSDSEGELAVDVYQTDGEIVIQSAVAGVKAEEIDVSVEDDVITIKGSRKSPPKKEEKNYFIQECHWGDFSRRIIISDEIDPSRIDAAIKDGILTVRIPRIIREPKSSIKIKESK